MKRSLFTLTVCLSFIALFPAFAGEKTKVDFAEDGLPGGWTSPKGEWTVTDGVLHGKELKSDQHAAVLSIPAMHSDSSIQFRFQVNGAKGFHLSYNHPRGHLFRIRSSSGKAALVMDKNKKDPTSKAVTLEDADLVLESGKWYDLSCTVKGTEVEVAIGDQKLTGSHPDLSKEKTGFRFIVQGESVVIDDIVYSTGK